MSQRLSVYQLDESEVSGLDSEQELLFEDEFARVERHVQSRDARVRSGQVLVVSRTDHDTRQRLEPFLTRRQ